MVAEPLRIELLYVRGCPHVDHARQMLRECLDELGLDVAVQEREGDFPSPTITVNGADVMGKLGPAGAMCRLDLPVRGRVLTALRGALRRPGT
jgi:hypothetical protein